MFKPKSDASKSNISVVIFCGGYGSRIREETVEKPKPMITIGGFPILWHIMKIYKHYGFTHFILTLGYKGDYIREFVKNDSKKLFDEFDMDLVDTGVSTPTGGRLLQVADKIKSDTFMCTYGDGVSDVDLNKVFSMHKKLGNVDCTITSVRVPHKFGIIQYDKKGLVRSYSKGHLMKDPINAGFMVMNKRYMEYLNDNMMIEDPFNTLAAQNKLAVYRHKGFFGAIDTYKDRDDLHGMWVANPQWKVWKK